MWQASKCIKDKYKILQSKKFLAHTLLTVQGQLSPFGQIISGELLRTVGIGGTLIGSAFSASVQCAAFQCVVCSGSGNSVAFSCQCTTCSTLGVRASVRCRPSTCQHHPPTSNRPLVPPPGAIPPNFRPFLTPPGSNSTPPFPMWPLPGLLPGAYNLFNQQRRVRTL